jgi:hypothetical protein
MSWTKQQQSNADNTNGQHTSMTPIGIGASPTVTPSNTKEMQVYACFAS